jgi:hypothetical protein
MNQDHAQKMRLNFQIMSIWLELRNGQHPRGGAEREKI